MVDLFDDKLFDVEHALVMHVADSVCLPAEAIYDRDLLRQFKQVIAKCHIYIIGFMPKVMLVGASQKGQTLTTTFRVLGVDYDLAWELPRGAQLEENETGWIVKDGNGRASFPGPEAVLSKLCFEQDAVKFEVKYVGQAYGKSGSRNALDRLTKHETLQKISLKGVPDGYSLNLVLIKVEPNNQVITMFNPHAKNIKDGNKRIELGIDKLFNTSERERVALYEAALIRYFLPDFNQEFKDSFPSTNLKILTDCYDKDFSAVVAELVIDQLPFVFFSGAVGAKPIHFAAFDLHTDEARKVFFAKE